MMEPQIETVVDRVKAALQAGTLDDVAARLGEKRATVGSWSARRSVPLDALVRVVEIANCSLDWLVFGSRLTRTGDEVGRYDVRELAQPKWAVAASPAPWMDASTIEGRAHPGEGPQGLPEERRAVPARLLRARGVGNIVPLVLSLPLEGAGAVVREYELIPKYVQGASAGAGVPTGADGEVLDLAGDMAFSFDWLRRNLGNTTGRLTAVQVLGNSMADQLLDGDTVIIDEGVNEVDRDDIYFVEFGGLRLLKRVQRMPHGAFVLRSDNAAYQPVQVTRAQAPELRIIGRVVWPRVR